MSTRENIRLIARAPFHENFIFANNFKRHISDVKNSRLKQDLPISINDRVILPFARVSRK